MNVATETPNRYIVLKPTSKTTWTADAACIWAAVKETAPMFVRVEDVTDVDAIIQVVQWPSSRWEVFYPERKPVEFDTLTEVGEYIDAELSGEINAWAVAALDEALDLFEQSHVNLDILAKGVEGLREVIETASY